MVRADKHEPGAGRRATCSTTPTGTPAARGGWRSSAGRTPSSSTVDDAGPGVPVEDRERIFERFARGAGAARRSLPGAGLGLAIVAETATRHGGAAWCADGPDGGARFCLSLPAEGP